MAATPGDHTRLMVQQGLGDGLRDAQHRHVGGHRATQVVDDPRLGTFGKRLVEPSFQATETRYGRFAGGREHVVRTEKPRHIAQDVQHRVGDRDGVPPAVLGALRRQGPQPFLEVEFRPAHLSDLGSPLAAQDQQLRAIPERIAFGVTGRPQRAELIICQHAFARSFLGQRFHPGDWVGVDHAALDAPTHKVLEVGKRSVRADRCRSVDQVAGPYHVGALDLVNPLAMQVGELVEQPRFVLPITIVNLGVLLDVIGDYFNQRWLGLDGDAGTFLEVACLYVIE